MPDIKATIVWDQKWSNKISQENFDRITERALTAVGLAMEGYASDLAPVDSGRLKGSITFATQTDQSHTRPPARVSDQVSAPMDKYTVHIGTNVEYAEAVEYGVPDSFVILPKFKKALFWKGAAHPVKRVVHPPIRAQSYLRRALDDNREEMPVLFRDEMRKGFGQQ